MVEDDAVNDMDTEDEGDDVSAPNATRFHVENNSTFDVSELAPYTLDRTVSGTGHVVGAVQAVTSGSVQPGSVIEHYTNQPYTIETFNPARAR